MRVFSKSKKSSTQIVKHKHIYDKYLKIDILSVEVIGICKICDRKQIIKYFVGKNRDDLPEEYRDLPILPKEYRNK